MPGSVVTQADQALRANIARALFGLDGTGIKVGVISDSYNNLGTAAADVASGDLPPNVTVLSDFPSGGSDEGRAMMQSLYDIAPGATLFFHDAGASPQDFAAGILALQNAGVDIIVDDISYYSEPFFQDGVVAQAVETAVGNGVVYLTSAGNEAAQSYDSPFRGVSNTAADAVVGQAANAYLWHDFDPGSGVDIFQLFTLEPEESIGVNFQWDQPFKSATPGSAGAANELDIFLLNADGTQLIQAPLQANFGGDAFEELSFTNSTNSTQQYSLAIGQFLSSGGPTAGRIKYLDARGGTSDAEFFTNDSTSVSNANTASVLTVGAAFYQQTPAFGQTPPIPEDSTSLGGTPILFDAAGNRLATPEVRDAPDFTAADGTNTTFFGDDFEGDGFPNFFGTSVAAPHAAGVVALMLQAKPNATKAEIEAALEATAIDMLTPGFDRRTGAGLIQADAAIANLLGITPALTLTINPTSISENGGTATATLTRNTGTSGALVVTLASDDTSEATVPATVTIPDGSASVTFAITGVDDAIVDGTQTPTITASASGFNNGIATIDITDDDVAVTPALTLTINPTSISENGGTATATLTRNTDTTSPLTVTLVSDDTSEATVPNTVTIPAGQTSATFAVSAVDDTAIDGTQTATITASAAGFSNVTGTIDVTDNESPAATLRIEAEAIANKTGYRLESNSAASGGQMLSLVGGGNNEVGTASFVFTGPSGTYDIDLGSFDENDGQASFTVTLNGNSLGQPIVLNQDLPSNIANNTTKVTRAVATGVMLMTGDSFVVTGNENGNEHARFDFIEFKAGNGGTNPPPTTAITVQAESIANKTGYRIENSSVASGGSMLSLLGGASNEVGTATFTFNGNPGTYEVILGTFDENDGQAQFEVKKNNVAIGPNIVLNQNLPGNAASSSTKVERTAGTIAINTGDTFTITGFEDRSEHARLDFIRFEAAGPVPQVAPVITTPSSITVPENQTLVLDINATDANGDTEGNGLTYSLTGGSDVSAFSLNASTGVLSFAAPPDFENPTDSNSNNVYGVQVTVTDSTARTAVQSLNITVSDVNETGVGTPIRLEAETAGDIVNYRTENIGIASGGKVLSFLGGGNNEIGSATFGFNGPAGEYDLIVGTFDENDGLASFTVQLKDFETNQISQIGSLDLNQNLGSNLANAQTFISPKVAFGVNLTPGDSLIVNGFENNLEHARLDFLELVPV